MSLSPSRAGSIRGGRSIKSNKSKKSGKGVDEDDGIPKFKKDFFNFHNENGVRTVTGSVGPIRDGEQYMASTLQSELIHQSPNAAKERVPTCVYLSRLRAEAWIHPQKRPTRDVWVRRTRKVNIV